MLAFYCDHAFSPNFDQMFHHQWLVRSFPPWAEHAAPQTMLQMKPGFTGPQSDLGEERILDVSMQHPGPSRTLRLDQALMAWGLKSPVDGKYIASMLACSLHENVSYRSISHSCLKLVNTNISARNKAFLVSGKKKDKAFLPLPHMTSMKSAWSWAHAMAFVSIKSFMGFLYWVSLGLHTVILQCRKNLSSQPLQSFVPIQQQLHRLPRDMHTSVHTQKHSHKHLCA